MGGLSHGDVASRLIVSSILEYLKTNYRQISDGQLIRNSLFQADDILKRECAARKSRMGASVAVIYIKESRCFYSSLGDVRIYQKRNGECAQLSTDDILYPNDHTFITKCINGRGLRETPDVFEIAALDGDELLIATDGYYLSSHAIDDGKEPDSPEDDATLVRISFK